MRSRGHRIAGAVLLIFLACPSGASLAQTKRDKSVWNYDGGVFLKTDGSLPNGVCFRVSGRLDSPEFFDDLKRVDSDQGPIFRRGQETVPNFPDMLLLFFVIHHHTC